MLKKTTCILGSNMEHYGALTCAIGTNLTKNGTFGQVVIFLQKS